MNMGNMQAMLKQARKMQADIEAKQKKISEMEFEGTSQLVTARVDGTKKILSVKINSSNIESDDIELFEDMIVSALNIAMEKVDKETEKQLGSYANSIPGLF